MRMKRQLAWPVAATALATLTCASTAYAGAVATPMADTSTASAQALVDMMLAPSSGMLVVAGSAQYTGAASASGTFVSGGTAANGLGIDSGVVLSSGDARFIGSSAAFVGDSANKTGDFTAGASNSLTPNTAPGNTLFSSLTSSPTFNASVLSFQFVPSFGMLKLSFVFGSEDYNDVVNSGFPTDVFGIFVNGVNYALVPGGNLAISASTINCGGPSSGTPTGVGAQNCNLYRDNAPFLDTIDSEVDGFTVVLDVTIPVNAAKVNIISIGIADAADAAGDSALLLRAGSMASVVPEPSKWALMLGGLAACAAFVWRRRV
jgi:hypothetical protein